MWRAYITTFLVIGMAFFHKHWKEVEKFQRAQQIDTIEAQSIQELTVDLNEVEHRIQQGSHAMEEMSNQLSRLQIAHAQATRRLEEIARKQQIVALEVVKGARLIGTTLTGITTNSALRERLFDAVIMDEASMASLAITLVTATHASRHIVVFGDPAQLAPIVQLANKKHAPLAAYWLGANIYAHRQVRLEDADTGTRCVVFLSEQSRMHPVIAAPISQMVYGGRLKTRVDPKHVVLQLAPRPEKQLMLIDTGDADRGKIPQEARGCETKRPPRGSSKYNLYHIKCIVQLIRQLLPQLPEQEKPLIGVITPYKAQQMKIQRTLREQGLLSRVHVGTVYSFQSAEYPCIIFDTVEGFGVPISRFTSDRWGRNGILSPATRLLNVAHTRAAVVRETWEVRPCVQWVTASGSWQPCRVVSAR